MHYKPIIITDSLLTRFWKYVDQASSLSGCWLWLAYKNSRGYGEIGTTAWTTGMAHRVSWVIHFGPIPGGLFVCHHCDNPSCVNPDHLFIGTHKDNMADMWEKGRQGSYGQFLKKGDQHWHHLQPDRLKGDNAPNRKVSVAKVQHIRLIYSQGGVTQEKLARQYGISGISMARILQRKTWGYVEDLKPEDALSEFLCGLEGKD